MSTKYILHGGLYHERPDNNIKAFGEEIVKVVGKDNVKILLCAFARPKELWQKYFDKDTNSFLEHFPKMEFVFAQPETFIEQAKGVDVIYFRGGDTERILEILKDIQGWLKAFDNKVFVGESAGVTFLSKYYFGLKSLVIEEALGILPIKVIVHWDSDYNAPNIDWDKAYNDLKNYKEDLPIITLKEGEFKVYEK